MRVGLTLLGALLLCTSTAQAGQIRTVDRLTVTSKAEELLGGRSQSVTTEVSRTLTPPEPGDRWTVAYERMTADGSPVPGAQGRSYAVGLVDGALTVEPIPPTDSAGLENVTHDLESLKPLFEGSSPAAICDSFAGQLCPVLASLLRRLGEPSLKSREADGALAIRVLTPGGETLEGSARMEALSWSIELDGAREAKIPYDVEGKGREVATARIVSHYKLVREFVEISQPVQQQ